MSWTILAGLVLALSTAVLVLWQRRAELKELDARRDERAHAIERGSHRARLQSPDVDPTRCIGCGVCVRACPEEGVLDVLHGQAVVVHGARCVGHGLCAEECPVGAIAVTLGDLSTRRDIPALGPALDVPGEPGLFLAGEVSGFALVRTAVSHGTAVAGAVARRLEHDRVPRSTAQDPLDLLVVGAGPAGLACSLEATAAGLQHVVLEREALGGTVSKYPRRKLVMTQPLDLPLYGRLDRSTYEKEELLAIWDEAIRAHDLPVRTGVSFQGLTRIAGGLFHVETSAGSFEARNVCLALGRRGTPRKLGVPGEELPKVLYELLDACSYTDADLLVVGGGDSAIEAALGLAEQPGNRVTLSYRKNAFTRIKARNEARLESMLAEGRLSVLFDSNVAGIGEGDVELHVGAAAAEGAAPNVRIPNDRVFVMAGGEPPFPLLERCGVSFDPAARPAAESLDESRGLFRALTLCLGLALGVVAWRFFFRDYYDQSWELRPTSPLHERLRPSGTLGLPLGIAAAALVLANLSYLARRSQRLGLALGSLRRWMSLHVVTGILALLTASVHASFAPRDTVGGYALVVMVVLVATGALGRYLYAFLPRAANGRELALDEVRARLASLSADWDRLGSEFSDRARQELDALTREARLARSLPRRIVGLVTAQRGLRAGLVRLRRLGRDEGLSPAQQDEVELLARRAWRHSLAAEHLEELRALVASWRWIHRWGGLLLVSLIALHVIAALRYGGLFS